jgi:hypothetical protein
VRLRWWEYLALGLAVCVAAMFLAAGSWLPAVVLFALVAIIAASRAEIVERNVAGYHARVRGMLALTRAAGVFAIYVAITILFFIMRSNHWTDNRRGQVAFYACAGLAFYLLRDVWRYGQEAERWISGGEAEQRVAAELDKLDQPPWIVIHNVPRPGRGNVDHFVAGPSAAFVVETKSGKLRGADRGQAISNAIWAKQNFGQRYVTAVVCATNDAPSEPLRVPHGNAWLWIVAPSQLRKLIER